MPHLDEGTLHALLDGELELAEVKEIQNHLGSCAACGSRLHDVKEFLTEADRLVADLQTPAGASKVRREPAPSAQPTPAEPGSQPISRERPWREPVWDATPELLLPEDPDEVARRRRRNRLFRWAAMIAVVVGVGQVVRSGVTSNELDLGDERDIVLAPSSAPPALVSPEERLQDSPAVQRSAPAGTKDRAPAASPASPRRAEAKVRAEQPVLDTSIDLFDTTVIAAAAADTEPDPLPAEATGGAERADTDQAERPTPETDAATREAAAAALEELDRERLRSRANAATAALPPPRPEPQATVEPAARTLEQKAQTYLRIGLDEAAKQLGRPMHVIEAMSPEFIGLAQGRSVPGADPNRPVVRVVYSDTRGRMILLDQQRLRTGQAPGAANGNLRWILGDVMLYLHGEPGNDVLRNLQRRVR